MGNLDVCPFKLPFVRDTFGFRWIDAVHVDCLKCLGEVHMRQRGLVAERINGSVETCHVTSHSTLGIHLLNERYACGVIRYYGRRLYASHVFLLLWAFVLYVAREFAIETDFPWEFEHIWTLSNFKKAIQYSRHKLALYSIVWRGPLKAIPMDVCF